MSSTSRAAGGAAPTRGRRVLQVDGLVLLKIIQHAAQHFPEYVHGQLLGLDVDNTTEVTHRFVYKQRILWTRRLGEVFWAPSILQAVGSRAGDRQRKGRTA